LGKREGGTDISDDDEKERCFFLCGKKKKDKRIKTADVGKKKKESRLDRKAAPFELFRGEEKHN